MCDPSRLTVLLLLIAGGFLVGKSPLVKKVIRKSSLSKTSPLSVLHLTGCFSLRKRKTFRCFLRLWVKKVWKSYKRFWRNSWLSVAASRLVSLSNRCIWLFCFWFHKSTVVYTSLCTMMWASIRFDIQNRLKLFKSL